MTITAAVINVAAIAGLRWHDNHNDTNHTQTDQLDARRHTNQAKRDHRNSLNAIDQVLAELHTTPRNLETAQATIANTINTHALIEPWWNEPPYIDNWIAIAVVDPTTGDVTHLALTYTPAGSFATEDTTSTGSKQTITQPAHPAPTCRRLHPDGTRTTDTLPCGLDLIVDHGDNTHMFGTGVDQT